MKQKRLLGILACIALALILMPVMGKMVLASDGGMLEGGVTSIETAAFSGCSSQKVLFSKGKKCQNLELLVDIEFLMIVIT